MTVLSISVRQWTKLRRLCTVSSSLAEHTALHLCTVLRSTSLGDASPSIVQKEEVFGLGTGKEVYCIEP